MKKIIGTLLVSLFLLVSCGNRPPLDIINPDAEYRYFFGATCPHCQELNAIAQERDLYSQISIEKREVYSNSENLEIFQTLIEELDADSSGVPFVYDTVTGEYAVGVRPALEMMTSRLGQTTSAESTAQEEVSQETEEIQETTGTGSDQ